MTSSRYTLSQITLAATNTLAMVDFYRDVFESDLHPIAAYGTTLYRGTLAGVTLLLCPNEIAGVQADQNRHQLTIAVPDLRATLQRVRESGGTLDAAAAEETSNTAASIRDPDGNTIELIQARGDQEGWLNG